VIDDEARTTSRSGKREGLAFLMVYVLLYHVRRQLQAFFGSLKNYFQSGGVTNVSLGREASGTLIHTPYGAVVEQYEKKLQPGGVVRSPSPAV
jgi:hypothetical protein